MNPRTLSAIAAIVWLCQGCIFVDDRGRGFGTLTAEWSIASAFDPIDCHIQRVDGFELVLYDRNGRFFAEVEAPCEAFNVSIDLPDGIYSADATLIDLVDRAATVTQSYDGLDVRGGTELVMSVNFPYGSFL